jgi:DNA gyrase/topoisomerase IV subunit B
MPGLIEDGRLYSAKPPLYTISDKSIKKYKPSKSYLYDKREYNTFENSIIAKNVDIAINGNILTHNEKLNWLSMNTNYLDELKHLENATACDPVILEYLCGIILDLPCRFTNGKTTKKIETLCKKMFSEMVYDEKTHSLSGAYNKKRYSLIIDETFTSAASGFLKAMSLNESIEVEYKNKHDEAAKPEIVTIGQFLKSVYSEYNVDVSQRFKGLGEFNPQLLFTATINPKTRKLVRLTMDDRDRVIKAMLDLHGMKNVDVRKNMLINANVDKDDIDT